MVRNNKTALVKFFSLMVAVILCFTVFTVPVLAEDGVDDPEKKDEKSKIVFLEDVNTDEEEPAVVEPIFEDGRWNRVHSNPATFEKNYKLSPELKEYVITESETILSDILEPEMSDLEKYYTIAVWLNHYVNYDWNFWPGGYDFDYYSHQWDLYGVLEERESVCAGIAISYANLCHAADLPCKFLRMKPYYLDHTINYIPDINGHAYYIDVTENLFFMSKKANPWNPLDHEFSCIPKSKIPDDGSFEYARGKKSYSPSGIKEFYGVPFKTWFKEYALHKNTKKKFKTKYVEKGSGVSGTHYASYKDYPKQFSETEKPGLWFLEDFYKDPETISSKILKKEFDEQLLNISGIKGSYDCNTAEELATAVNGDIAIKYFPSAENGEVVTKSVGLMNDTDFTVTCDTFNPTTGEATITIAGAGEYTGEYQLPVRFNSAAITKAPVVKTGLAYTGEPQTLIEPGTAENGTILYGAYSKVGEDESWKKGNPDAEPYPEPDVTYSEEIPTTTDAGRFNVWYKVVGDETHFDLPPQRLERVAIIAPIQTKISIADQTTLKVGEKIQLTPVLNVEKAVEFDYMSANDAIATVSNDGIVKGVAVGTSVVLIGGKLQEDDPNYVDPEEAMITIKVSKGDNPMKLTGKTAKVKRSKLKVKAQTIKRSNIIAVSKAKGKTKYKLVSVKKGKKSFKKYFKVNYKTGNVTVKKGLKKGNYLVTVNVRATGNANYKASDWMAVTSTVKVK